MSCFPPLSRCSSCIISIQITEGIANWLVFMLDVVSHAGNAASDRLIHPMIPHKDFYLLRFNIPQKYFLDYFGA
jgi:hypothetical protein